MHQVTFSTYFFFFFTKNTENLIRIPKNVADHQFLEEMRQNTRLRRRHRRGKLQLRGIHEDFPSGSDLRRYSAM